MESDNPWYTREVLLSAIICHLKKKGYHVHLPESIYAEKTDDIILAYKWKDKSIIEIKGYCSSPTVQNRKEQFQKVIGEKNNNWFQKNILTYLLSLASQYKNMKLPVSLCLPDLTQYRAILKEVQTYFVSNKLHLNVYLVKLDSSVEEWNMSLENESEITLENKNVSMD